jgi:hypothetical protein
MTKTGSLLVTDSRKQIFTGNNLLVTGSRKQMPLKMTFSDRRQHIQKPCYIDRNKKTAHTAQEL